MKKILTFAIAILLCCGWSLQAAPVSKSRALDVAKLIFASQPATKASGDVKLIWDGEDVATKASAQPAFYVFGRDGGGFVIIAGDDNVRPVLAISEDSPFAIEEMPDNVKWWMDQMKAYVRSARTQSPEAARQWADLVATKAKLDESLFDSGSKNMNSATVCWNQSAPANLNAPVLPNQNDERSVCGCLPLAVAEILTWFGWPNQGVGSTTEYQYYATNSGGTKTTMPALDLTTLTISDAEWTALQALDTYQEFQECVDPIRSKLAELVYDCGLLVQAKFNAGGVYGGTSANSQDVPANFAEHMKYSWGSHIDFLANHTFSEWNALLKAQVLDHPLLYCGRASLGGGNDAGHAYVLDGHATLYGEDVFHFNFGWGERCNGFYYSHYQDTRGGVENSPYNFDIQLEALLDFIPDKNGMSKATRELSYVPYTIGSDELFGLQANVQIQKDVTFPLQFGLLYNYSAAQYEGWVKLVLEDKNSVIKEDLVTMHPSVPSNMGIYYLFSENFNVTVTSDLAFGDRIAFYYSTDNPADVNDAHFLKVGGPRDGTAVLELPVMPVTFILTKGGAYSVGESFVLQLTNTDSRYAGTTWTITEPDGTVNSNIPQSQREFKLTQSGTYKIQAAVAPKVGADVVETIVTYITVN